jgi:hypothetical protein
MVITGKDAEILGHVPLGQQLGPFPRMQPGHGLQEQGLGELQRFVLTLDLLNDHQNEQLADIMEQAAEKGLALVDTVGVAAGQPHRAISAAHRVLPEFLHHCVDGLVGALKCCRAVAMSTTLAISSIPRRMIAARTVPTSASPR